MLVLSVVAGDWPSVKEASAGNSSGEDDRAALADMWASVLDRGERSPIPQLKGVPGLLKIRVSKLVQLQAVTCGENQVIKGVNVREKAFHRLLVEDVNRLSTYISSDGLDGVLNSFCVAGDYHDVRSLRCCFLGDG